MSFAVVEDQAPNWIDILIKGVPGPRPPALRSERIKDLAGRGMLTPRALSVDEIREMSAAIINDLMTRRQS